jgi:bifunctional non-homologous end joining protein LigD
LNLAAARALLKTYREKRDFSRTSEPRGKHARKTGRSFVVQKHDATRLHYDFRLELDGVLKSWAVTRGPSLDPKDKRLAVEVEDHPLDYASFEGTIPKREYGGGTVMVWDRGTWEPEGDPHEGLRKGELKFTLDGERMKGGWVLVRMARRSGEKRNNWLLIKHRDKEAKSSKTWLARETRSAATGRTMEEISSGSPTTDGKQSKLPLPKFTAPQLATLVKSVPEGSDWIFEDKYDGYRCLAAISADKVKLYTRKGLDWTQRFQPLVAPLSTITRGSALIDGEVCAIGVDGKTDFSALADHLANGGPLVYFAFDLLEQDGKPLQRLPLRERKSRLENLLGKRTRNSPVQFSPHIEGNGVEVFKALCKAGHEGLIAKQVDDPYRGARTKSWLKVKCFLAQEFIIVGWSDSEKLPFSSLLLATREKGKLVYRGRVGTGFSTDDRSKILARLKKLERDTSPLDQNTATLPRHPHWVRPELAAEITFTELTPDGALRHPAFLGLREDKPAGEIKLEKAKALGRKKK